MKNCIWCLKNETETLFENEAHTVPQSLGGKNICENVCDKCNHFFGSSEPPSIEVVLKEAFNISRALLLHSINETGKNKTLVKPTSQFFKIDLSNRHLEIKHQFKLTKGFQKNLCNKFKKGLYKIFLEERERKKGDGHDKKYDFIREYARYGIGDYPIYYFEKRIWMAAMPDDWIKHPQLFFDKKEQYAYLVQEPGFFEFEFLGHVFSMPTVRNWEIMVDNYIKNSAPLKKEIFNKITQIENFNDMDIALSVLNK